MKTAEICSGCNEPKPTVNRNMFDGMCADCTNIALWSDEFAKKAEMQNNKLIRNQ